MNYQKILQESILKIQNSNDENHLITSIKPSLLGKDGIMTQLLSSLKNFSIEEKKSIGPILNDIRSKIEVEISKKLNEFEELKLNQQLETENIDITLPYRQSNIGSLSPLTKSMIDAIKILEKYGFSFSYGPEIEEDFFNFEALNMPKNHPARQMQDTFYLNGKNPKDENYILRTHTTSVDIRTILKNNLKPPIALASCGKTFRVDSDRTHSPMFHQVEALMIDQNLNMGNLKFLLESFLRDFFETENISIRFRPSFFPFTEPSAEVDIGYEIIDGKIIIGGSKNYLEILGCGMIHPNVLRNINIDSEKYRAIAFGCGLERITMLKHGITDLRKFTSANNVQWMKHFSFFANEI